MKLAELECYFILHTFQRCAGDRDRIARELGIGLRTLANKLRQYGVPPRAKTVNAVIPAFLRGVDQSGDSVLTYAEAQNLADEYSESGRVPG